VIPTKDKATQHTHRNSRGRHLYPIHTDRRKSLRHSIPWSALHLFSRYFFFSFFSIIKNSSSSAKSVNRPTEAERKRNDDDEDRVLVHQKLRDVNGQCSWTNLIRRISSGTSFARSAMLIDRPFRRSRISTTIY
jgi:hypothetical protein